MSRQHEVRYLGYYGYPIYSGGAVIWGAGMVPFAMVPGYVAGSGSQAEGDITIEKGQKGERARHRDDDPHLRSCVTVIGYHLHATDGEVGHVEGFLVDDETWAIRYFVVNTSNWLIGHRVLVAPPWIDGMHWSDRTVSVDLSRGEVKGAPPYDPAAGLDQQSEAGLYTHYGRPPYWMAASTHERGN